MKEGQGNMGSVAPFWYFSGGQKVHLTFKEEKQGMVNPSKKLNKFWGIFK
jgi:hypothetical protein